MARYDGGWVKLHRGLVDHWIGKDGVAFAIFAKLILWANFKESKYIQGSEIKVLKLGQVLTSVNEIAVSLGFDKKAVERRLNLLEKDGSIVQEVSNKGRKISICNWGEYQEIKNESVKQKGNERVNERVNEGETGGVLNEEVKKLTKKEVKKERRLSHGTPPASRSLPEGDFDEANASSAESSSLPENLSLLPERTQTPGSIVWGSYEIAYKARYGVSPTRNAKTNSLCAQLAKRLPEGDSASVVAFYVSHNDRWYVSKCHALEYAVKDAEKLHMEWKNGRQMTSLAAKRVERDSNTLDVIANYYKKRGVE